MESVTPFDWYRLFIGKQPPLYFLEIIFRVVVIYTFTVLVLRYMGKRGQRQMTPFELVLVIALGSATGDSMLYPEVPIFYAWLIIVVMVGLDRLLSELQLHYKGVNIFLEGKPRMLVREGQIIANSLRKEQLRHEEFMALLREQQIASTGDLEYVFLEPTGNLGLLRRSKTAPVEGESTYPQEQEYEE